MVVDGTVVVVDGTVVVVDGTVAVVGALMVASVLLDSGRSPDVQIAPWSLHDVVAGSVIETSPTGLSSPSRSGFTWMIHSRLRAGLFCTRSALMTLPFTTVKAWSRSVT